MRTLGLIATLLVLPALASADVAIAPGDVTVDQSVGTFQVLIPIEVTGADLEFMGGYDVSLTIVQQGGLEFVRGNRDETHPILGPANGDLNRKDALDATLNADPDYFFNDALSLGQSVGIASSVFSIDIQDISNGGLGDTAEAGSTFKLAIINLTITDPTIANSGPVVFDIVSSGFTVFNIVPDDITPPTTNDGFTVTITPEPTTMALLAFGGLGVLLRRKRSA
jgi:hypothetical protein